MLARACAIVGLLSCASVVGLAEPVTFSTADRVLLAEYRVLARENAPLLIATAPKRTGAVANTLVRRGAQIIGRRDAIGYLYAFVPLEAVADVLSIEGVEAAQVAANPVRARMEAESPSSPARAPGAAIAPKPGSGKVRPAGVPPSAALGPDNPYTGEAATQAFDFKSRHPTFDGRGVVAAFVEPVAPNLETLRGALDLSGRPREKFARYNLMASAAPAEAVANSDSPSVIWQKTERVEPGADGTFKWRDRSYRLPMQFAPREIASIHWRMCRRLAGPFMDEQDILWAENIEQVWSLPASVGGDFSQAPFASLHESLAWVALDVPAGATGAMKAQALVFSANRQQGLLAIAPTLAGHGGMVGTVMAGSGFVNSKANGVAPAAQLSIFLASRQPYALGYAPHEQILEMLSDPDVDVAQASMSVGDTSRFGTASIQRIWANRLIAASGKPFVKAAGNYGPWLHGMGEFEMAETVFAVGAYTPRATWLANLGFEPAGQHVLASYSAWGPARDGGLKPDFLALTHTLSEGSPWRWYWNIDGKSYSVSGGTSAAAPQGAGHVALLVSAAKQTGVPHDTFRLRAAIATTAKFLDGVEARAQGHGLIQVSDAWQALQRAQRWMPPSFEIRAPLVGQRIGPEGPERFTGRGLFELSGWKPGQAGRRELIVTRTGGKRDASRFLLRWKGHTSSFRSPLPEVELPLGRPVSIPVEIQVRDSGSYSAILDLIDPQTQLVAGSVLNAVMVADPLVLDGEGLRYERETPRPGSTLFYVDVPAGAAALTVSLAKDATKSDCLVIDPNGRLMPFNPYGSEVYRANSNEIASREQHFVFPDPIPGVWQFEMRVVEPRSMAELDAVDDWSRPMPLSVHIQGWTSTEGETAIMSASRSAEVRLHAVAGAPDARVEPVGLGAARDAVAVLRPGLEPVFFDLQVDPGTASVEIEMDHGGIEPGEQQAHVGLYVFKLPEGERVARTLDSDQTLLVYYDASFQPRKRYSLAAPAPGRYRVALDPIHLRGSQVEVAYRDVIHHPVFGTVSVGKGDGGSATAAVAVRARPADGRRLYAQVGLFKPVGPRARALLVRQRWFVEP